MKYRMLFGRLMPAFVLTAAAAAVATGIEIGTVHANELPIPRAGFALDHVFLIMMENHTSTEIIGNPNLPFVNAYAKVANYATNYYAVGHPSLPNYLEIIGGSNFGVNGDVLLNWANGGCIDNESSTGKCSGVQPISTAGFDNPVIATATPGSSECNGQIHTTPNPNPVQYNCARYTYLATTYVPKTLAHQLVAAHKTWKTYQEDLPTVQPGVNGVNYSDGELSNLSPASVLALGAIPELYAVQHNPFVYFLDVQTGSNPELSLDRVKDFDGPHGLWADLANGDVPNLSFIVPNRCHDQHGSVSGATVICASATDVTAQLMLAQGDAEDAKLVNGIKASRAWQEGRNAIVLVWDENDYSSSPNTVVLLVETNYAPNGKVDPTVYDHFSLLRTLEAGFGLPCLNHACDSTSLVMNTMFGGLVAHYNGE